MAIVSPELRAALDVAKDRIKPDSYYPRAMNGGLKGHAQGFISGSIMGGATGAITGGLCSLALMLAGSGLTVVGWPLILGVASVGIGMGGFTGSRIGASAGAAASVAGERERRDKGEALEQAVLQSPEKQRAVIQAYRDNPVVEKDENLQQTFATAKTRGDAWRKLIDGKTLIFTIGVAALIGAVVCAGAFALAPGALVAAGAASKIAGTAAGISLGWGSLTATTMGGAALIGAGLGSGVGVAFGITYPMIFTTLTQTVSQVLSFRWMRGEKNIVVPVKTVAEAHQQADQLRGEAESTVNLKRNWAPEIRSQQAQNISIQL